MSIKKAIALILVLALMAAGGYYLLKTEREDDAKMRNLYAEVEPLERRREALTQELAGLDSDYALKMRDYGTVEILFPDLDAQIISDVYPIMRDRGVVGVLGFPGSMLPGYYNKLSWSDCATLVKDGWGTCFVYDSWDGNFTYWYQIVSSYFKYNRIPVPTSIYFIKNNYDSSLDEQLIACGIDTVILNGTDGRSNTVTDISSDLWITYAMPWNYTGSSADVELIGRTDSSNLVFTMTMKDIWNPQKAKNHAESEEKASFTAVLDSWQEMLYSSTPLDELDQLGPTPYIYVDTSDPDVLHSIYLDSLTPEEQLLLPKFQSMTLDTALDYHRAAIENKELLTREKAERASQIEKEIADLGLQIQELYSRYGVSMNSNTEQ